MSSLPQKISFFCDKENSRCHISHLLSKIPRKNPNTCKSLSIPYLIVQKKKLLLAQVNYTHTDCMSFGSLLSHIEYNFFSKWYITTYVIQFTIWTLLWNIYHLIFFLLLYSWFRFISCETICFVIFRLYNLWKYIFNCVRSW